MSEPWNGAREGATLLAVHAQEDASPPREEFALREGDLPFDRVADEDASLVGVLLCELRWPVHVNSMPIDLVHAWLRGVRTALETRGSPLEPAAPRPLLDPVAAEVARLEKMMQEALAAQMFEEAARLRDLLVPLRQDRERLEQERTAASTASSLATPAGWATCFTKESLAILEAAKSAAEERGRPGIEPVHLLLSILAAPESRASKVLAAIAIDIEALRSRFEPAPVDKPALANLDPLRVSPGTIDALLVASAEAGGLGCEEIGSEHLLVGLLSVRTEAPAQLLGAEGLTLDAARFAALELSLVRGG